MSCADCGRMLQMGPNGHYCPKCENEAVNRWMFAGAACVLIAMAIGVVWMLLPGVTP